MTDPIVKLEGGLRFCGRQKIDSNEKPLVTVITVVYNGAHDLERTINSVASQNYENVEYIIIDGGSNDGTIDIIGRHEDKIDYWVSEKDFGIYDAMNKGIRAARGQWLNMMNCGDVFSHTDAFACLAASAPFVDIYYSDTILIDADTRISVSNVSKRAFIHQSLIYKKDLHERHGMYLSALDVTISDYLFFANIWRESNSKKVSEPIARYRVDGVSSNKKHFYQKMAVDLMCGFRSPVAIAMILLLHPLYNTLKRILRAHARVR